VLLAAFLKLLGMLLTLFDSIFSDAFHLERGLYCVNQIQLFRLKILRVNIFSQATDVISALPTLRGIGLERQVGIESSRHAFTIRQRNVLVGLQRRWSN